MRLSTWRAGLLLLAVLLLPFNVEIELAQYGGFSDLQHRVSIFLFDLPLLALTVLFLVSLARQKERPSHLLLPAGALLLVLTGIALAVHPSARGFQVMARLLVNLIVPAATWMVLSTLWRRRLLTALVGAGMFQAAIAIAQVIRGETLGLTFLGENPPLLPFGDALGAKGTFVHPYMLAAFALLACSAAIIAYLDLRSPVWLVSLPIVAVPVALTYSRMSAVAVAAMVIVLAVTWFKGGRWAGAVSLALLLGIAVPGLMNLDAWLGKAEPVPAETGIDAVTNFRGTFTDQAMDLISEEPIVGVGPGLYVLALEERLDIPQGEEVFPVHDVPLLVAAETGVIAGALVVAMLVGLGYAAAKAGPTGLIAYVAFLPFVLLDHFPYDNFQGLTMTGIWVGMILREVKRW